MFTEKLKAGGESCIKCETRASHAVTVARRRSCDVAGSGPSLCCARSKERLGCYSDSDARDAPDAALEDASSFHADSFLRSGKRSSASLLAEPVIWSPRLFLSTLSAFH